VGQQSAKNESIYIGTGYIQGTGTLNLSGAYRVVDGEAPRAPTGSAYQEEYICGRIGPAVEVIRKNTWFHFTF
jgi:hypothetical protein